MLQECHTLIIVLLYYGSFEELFFVSMYTIVSTKIYQLRIVGYLRYNNNTFSPNDDALSLSLLLFSTKC